MKKLLERHWKLGITILIRNLLQPEATTLQMFFFSVLYDDYRSTNSASKPLFKLHGIPCYTVSRDSDSESALQMASS